MTLNKLCSAIAKKEGKKVQARIGEIREIIKILVLMHVEYETAPYKDDSPLMVIHQAAAKRIKSKRWKKKK